MMNSASSPAETHVVLHGDLRAIRAFRLAANGHTWTRLSSGAYAVPSESEAGVIHRVTPDTCTCFDSQRGNCCKHRLAVAVYTTIQELLKSD